jgi:hypothetical protein
MDHLSAYDSIVYPHLNFTVQPIQHAETPDIGVLMVALPTRRNIVLQIPSAKSIIADSS